MFQLDFDNTDFSDGLWYDLPDYYVDQYRPRFSTRRNLCEVSGRARSPRIGIPGSVLSGTSHYVACVERFDLERNGFTFSFLVKLEDFNAALPITLLSFGSQGNRPSVSLEKPWWLRNELRFSVDLKNTLSRVRSISLHGFVGQWKHVVVTWNEMQGAAVYIDGEESGVANKYGPRSNRLSGKSKTGSGQPDLFLGSTTFGRKWRRGYVNGSMSTLMFWRSALERSEVTALSDFFGDLTKASEEPVLSLRHLRLMAPFRERFCFDHPIRLSEIYDPENDEDAFNCDAIEDFASLIRPVP